MKYIALILLLMVSCNSADSTIHQKLVNNLVIIQDALCGKLDLDYAGCDEMINLKKIEFIEIGDEGKIFFYRLVDRRKYTLSKFDGISEETISSEMKFTYYSTLVLRYYNRFGALPRDNILVALTDKLISDPNVKLRIR